MAHLATKRFNYWSQLAIGSVFCGIGFFIAGLLALLFLPGQLGNHGTSATAITESLLKPENTNLFRWLNSITAFLFFFLPAIFYALLCHKKPFVHLGFNKGINIQQILLIVFIMMAALPVVSMLQEITEMLPWKHATMLKFKEAEDLYNRQVAVMARMNDFSDYLITMVVIAFLPALFEETLFRGGLQNLLSRWFKMPILAIVVTSVIFSAIHGSYIGFLSRFALSFVLGWMYYRTSNIWLNIIAHFFNNAFAVTMLYAASRPGQKIDPSKIDERFPLWYGLVGLIIVIGLFVLFEKLNKKQIDRPGEEVLIPGGDFLSNPFENEPRFTNQPPTT
ncbi:MAG: CPBP family intramembrane glutamic endopeptidase [Ferruginibacter sp.]